MSFPRLVVLVLPVVLGVPLLAGGCAAPVVAGASYGTDAASLVGSGKTTSDHFISIVSKQDCALWRMFRNQDICRKREGDPNPYNVNYDEPFRQVSEGGVEYAPAPHSPADAPPASWDSAAYPAPPQTPASQPAAAAATAQAEPAAVQPEAAPPPEVAPAPAPAKAKPAKARHAKTKKAKAAHPRHIKKKPVKQPAPSPAAPSP